MWPVSSLNLGVGEHIAKIQVGGRLFWNQLNDDNSADIEQIRAKFNTETGSHVLELALPSKFRWKAIRNNKTANIYVKKLPF